MTKGKVYMIPSFIDEGNENRSIPAYNVQVVNSIKYFAVENLKSARRFLKRLNRSIVIDDLTFFDLNKKTADHEIQKLLKPLLEGNDIGIISEAGCPGIADPGARLASLAHENNIHVVPLIGPSSILLALIASGLNGQGFTFHGYLPIKPHDRQRKLKEIEGTAKKTGYTQIFMETPYRNNHLIEDCFNLLHPETKLCIAANINNSKEYIRTKSIQEWKKINLPNLHKVPAIFLIG